MLTAGLSKPHDKDIFGILAVGVELPYRKKLVATASRCECVYKQTGERSVTFCGRGGAKQTLLRRGAGGRT